jgi:peptide/nickel transport system permease protein
MWLYILRKLLYSAPILIGVNIITFILFFIVNTPDDMARIHLGGKRVTEDQVQQWKIVHGYDRPFFYNSKQVGIKKITDSLFVDQSIKLFTFNFGVSDTGRNIIYDIKIRMWPSLSIALPAMIIGLIINIVFALVMVFFRGSYVDYVGSIVCISLMSVSALFFIIGGQFLFAKVLKWFPISGYNPIDNNVLSIAKFVCLPVLVAVIASIGSDTRLYRSFFLEEISKDYVITARANGLSASVILFKHVLKNAMIPILTNIVYILPYLFMGSLLLESFFGIPGLGSYTIDAINQQDFAVVKAMVFIGALLYIIGLVITDVTYALVDPRIKFE